MRESSFADACDCHVHVVGPTDQFPQVVPGSYSAGLAMLESLRAAAEPVGVSRFVIVQPSFYGNDNSCLLEALEKLGGSGRGVAVVDAASTSFSMLASYGRHGVCGLRLNVYSSVVADADRILERSLKQTLGILPPGWHIEIIARAGTLAAAAPFLVTADVPVVINHYGLPESESTKDRAGRALLDLAASPNVWIKLSAPYRCSTDPLSTSPPAEWLTALLHAAPDRCVWGSDWPHTPPRSDAASEIKTLPYRSIAYGRLFNDFLAALVTPETARRILIENPNRLYGFANPQHGASG